MENVQIVRCGRGGCLIGDIIRENDRYYVVRSFSRQLVDGTRENCQYDHCGYRMNIVARPASEEEIAAYLEEKEAQRQRMAAYERKVMERRRLYLASRENASPA
jgi:hypothetical protein